MGHISKDSSIPNTKLTVIAEKVRPAIFVVTMSCVKARICNIITEQTNEYEVMNEEEDCNKKKNQMIPKLLQRIAITQSNRCKSQSKETNESNNSLCNIFSNEEAWNDIRDICQENELCSKVSHYIKNMWAMKILLAFHYEAWRSICFMLYIISMYSLHIYFFIALSLEKCIYVYAF